MLESNYDSFVHIISHLSLSLSLSLSSLVLMTVWFIFLSLSPPAYYLSPSLYPILLTLIWSARKRRLVIIYSASTPKSKIIRIRQTWLRKLISYNWNIQISFPPIVSTPPHSPLSHCFHIPSPLIFLPPPSLLLLRASAASVDAPSSY